MPKGISNYEPLDEQIMQADGGRTWPTEFPRSSSLLGESSCGNGSTFGRASSRPD